MDRRCFLSGLAVGTACVAMPVAASPARSCKIIGIGGAGCNFLLASLRSGVELVNSQWMPELICIDLDSRKLNEVAAYNATQPGQLHIKAMSLASCGSGGNSSMASAIAMRQSVALRGLLADATSVLLVAGVGGGTGSGVAPFIARLARAAGAYTLAAIITPFEFEGEARRRNAEYAINLLSPESHLVLRFSNQALMDTLGEKVTMEEHFAIQDQRIALGLCAAQFTW